MKYLEYLGSLGVRDEDFPAVQPALQSRVWARFEHGAGAPALAELIRRLAAEDGRFHMEGGSWTGDVSWVRGYEGVLQPMDAASALFHEKAQRPGVATSEPRYRAALFHLLTSETSCYRYWGEGRWTDYGREIARRTIEILQREF